MDGTFYLIFLVTGFSSSFGSSSYHFYSSGKTWEDANNFCTVTNAELLQSEDIPPQVFQSVGYAKAWIGLVADLLQWTWPDGQPAEYFNWSAKQPDDNMAETCVFMTDVGDWYDQKCSELRKSVCFNGSYFTIESELKWADAVANCEEKNSTLIQITDDLTNAEVKHLLPQSTEVWIGVHRPRSWVWSQTEEVVTTSNWAEGQPDNLSGNENCAAMKLTDGTWTDEPCDSFYPFICRETLVVRNSKITVVKQKIQTTANLEDPVVRAHLVEQLSAMLVNQGVTDFRLAWRKIKVQQERR